MLSRSSLVPPIVRPSALVVTLGFSGLLVAIMQTLMVPLLASLPELTGTTISTASWAVTATLVTGCVFTPLLGRMGDMYGKRRILMITLVMLLVGSVMCGMTNHIGVLILGRALQGATLAVIPLGMSIMRDELPPAKVLPSLALLGGTLGIGGAIGLPLSAVLIEFTDWHTMFWASSVMAIVAILLVRRFVPESPLRTAGRFDLLGALGLSVTLVSLLLGLEKGQQWGWLSTRTLVSFTIAVVTGLTWGWYELRTTAPMVDLRVSARRAVLLTNLSSAAVGFAFFGNSLLTAQLVQEPTWTGYGLGKSIAVSGLCLLPGGLAMALLSPVSARISRTRGPKVAVEWATLAVIVGYVVRYFGSQDLTAIIVASLIISAGGGLAYSAFPALIMRAVPATETGAANGLNTLMRSIGQSLSSAVAASVLTGVTITIGGRTAPALEAYLIFFIIGAAMSAVAFIITLFIPGKRADQKIAREAGRIIVSEELPAMGPGSTTRVATR